MTTPMSETTPVVQTSSPCDFLSIQARGLIEEIKQLPKGVSLKPLMDNALRVFLEHAKGCQFCSDVVTFVDITRMSDGT